MKNHITLVLILISLYSVSAQQNFKNCTWQETVSYITEHKNELLDFSYYTPKKTQTVVIKNNILLIKVVGERKKYIHKVDLKKLEKVRDYKNEGLFLSFGWKNVQFSTYNIILNKPINEQKGMHYGVRITNKEIRNHLKMAFERLVVLNKKK